MTSVMTFESCATLTKSAACCSKSVLNWPVELSMMRWTSSSALLKSSDINVTTLCRAAAAYSALLLLQFWPPCGGSRPCSRWRPDSATVHRTATAAAIAFQLGREPAPPRPGRCSAPPSSSTSSSTAVGLVDRCVVCVFDGLDRRLGGLRVGLGLARRRLPASASTASALDFGTSAPAARSSLPAKPDRPCPCARRGGHRLRLGGLGFGFLGQRQRLLRVRRTVAAVLSAVHRRGRRRSPTHGA